MASNFFFFYQQGGKEDTWQMALSSEREKIVKGKRPAFSTILDLSGVPDDNDWTKVRYQGPYYVDFDAEGDIELACSQFVQFLAKLDAELDFDISQASLFCSGGKGFHIEIPQACFMPKLPPTGTAWLPYIYREVSQSLYLDTLDLNVYTGKRGRQWRTTNVERENGCYKVPLTVEEALGMTPELYAEIIAEPRDVDSPTPPVCNSKFAMLFDRSKDKIVAHMRGKKKRQDKAVTFLEPWKKAKKTPPSIQKIMAGEDLAEGARFQNIAMQLAIYATSAGMERSDFLARCEGLCKNHVSDSSRYSNYGKRQNELARMFDYMQENSLYDFETAPLVRLLKEGTPTPDLGVMETTDRDDDTPNRPVDGGDVEDGDPGAVATDEVTTDAHATMRRGFFMNGQGMFKRNGDNIDSICRATLRKVESMCDVETRDFRGYEFDLVVSGKKIKRTALSSDAFTSAQKMRQFMSAHQLSFQGGDPETNALLDIMADKASRGGQTYVYPREGFFIIKNPTVVQGPPVKVYLTQDHFLCSVKPDDPQYFRLKYRPVNATSGYNIDIHQAKKLGIEHLEAIKDLFLFNQDSVLADIIGWFVAAHYRALYAHCFGEFPILHLWGEAGSGKSQTVMMMARLHWADAAKVSIKSAMSSTNFALDVDVSSSTSCPMIIDEWKPKELKQIKGRYEKLKDVIKMSYITGEVGNRGVLNKGAESTLGVIKTKATAPIVFMAEAIEAETAIFERSIVVPLSQDLHKGNKVRTRAFERLQANGDALSALGREIVEMGFSINLDSFKAEVLKIKHSIEDSLPDFADDTRRRAAPRLIYNRAVILHALSILKRILHNTFDDEFDAVIDRLTGSRVDSLTGAEGAITQMQGMSEISKILSRFALLSRARDESYELLLGKDYLVGEGWVELRVERCYDKYRTYCARINDTPLFDSSDALVFAITSYSPTTDRQCANSELREDGSTERIVRLDTRKLTREGVQAFRS